MTGFAKGMIVTGVVLVLLIVVVIGAGVYWVSLQTGPLFAKSTEAMEEGRRFGASTDNAGCVSETLARYQKEPGFTGAVTGQVFMGGCLRVSLPTEGFCDGVPGPTEFMRVAEWRREQCAQAGLGKDAYCQQIFTPVQSYCERQRKAAK